LSLKVDPPERSECSKRSGCILSFVSWPSQLKREKKERKKEVNLPSTQKGKMASSILSKGESGGLEDGGGSGASVGSGSTFSTSPSIIDDPLIMFSTNLFPMDSGVKAHAGLPFGCVIRPFAPHETCGLEGFNGVPLADDIARCGSCFAYINPLSTLDVSNRRWRCPFCFHDRNPLTSNRYHTAIRDGTLASLPEIQQRVMEYVIDKPTTPSSSSSPSELHSSGVFLAVVDLSNNDKQYLEMVKRGLSALLEAMSPSAFFGLITFSDRIGIHDLRSPVPHAKNIRIPSKGDDLALTLSEVLHISSFFVKVTPPLLLSLPSLNYASLLLLFFSSIISSIISSSLFFYALLLILILFPQKETFELNISSTIESLSHFVTESGVGKCGFGSTIASVLDYLSNSEENLKSTLSSPRSYLLVPTYSNIL
jgi:hypothetical protein